MSCNPQYTNKVIYNTKICKFVSMTKVTLIVISVAHYVNLYSRQSQQIYSLKDILHGAEKIPDHVKMLI